MRVSQACVMCCEMCIKNHVACSESVAGLCNVNETSDVTIIESKIEIEFFLENRIE